MSAKRLTDEELEEYHLMFEATVAGVQDGTAKTLDAARLLDHITAIAEENERLRECFQLLVDCGHPDMGGNIDEATGEEMGATDNWVIHMDGHLFRRLKAALEGEEKEEPE